MMSQRRLIDLFGYVLALAIVIAALGVAIAYGSERNLAIGDSIALGTGHAMRVPTVARVGAGSCEILRWLPARGNYSHVVVSAGINDRGMCVASIRLNLHAQHVTWIVPAPINPAAAEVLRIAHKYGDGTVGYACPGGCSKVSFHPANYATVARAVYSDWAHH